MGKLVIKLNNSVVDQIELAQGDMIIGRKPGCEIHLDNLSVSGEHANIFTIRDDSFIQDLGSTNGTYVNGKKVSKHHLKNGDTVHVGKYSLAYQHEATATPADYAKTVIITTPVPEDAKPADKKAPAKAAPAAGQASLITLGSGKRIELIKTVTNLGKAGKHAGAITRTADGYMLASGEGEPPKLNGRPVSAKQVKLRNGDIIEVTGTRLQFQLR